jgi:hypothetical protein
LTHVTTRGTWTGLFVLVATILTAAGICGDAVAKTGKGRLRAHHLAVEGRGGELATSEQTTWTDALLRWSEISDVAWSSRKLDAAGIGSQHWSSPQIEIRPEVSYYKSLDANAFNGNANFGIPAKELRHHRAADLIIHF